MGLKLLLDKEADGDRRPDRHPVPASSGPARTASRSRTSTRRSTSTAATSEGLAGPRPVDRPDRLRRVHAADRQARPGSGPRLDRVRPAHRRDHHHVLPAAPARLDADRARRPPAASSGARTATSMSSASSGACSTSSWRSDAGRRTATEPRPYRPGPQLAVALVLNRNLPAGRLDRNARTSSSSCARAAAHGPQETHDRPTDRHLGDRPAPGRQDPGLPQGRRRRHLRRVRLRRGRPAAVPGQADLPQAPPDDRRPRAVRSGDRRRRRPWREGMGARPRGDPLHALVRADDRLDRREARLVPDPDRRRPDHRRVLRQEPGPGRAGRQLVPVGRPARDLRGPRLHRLGRHQPDLPAGRAQRRHDDDPDRVRVVHGRGARLQDPAAALAGGARRTGPAGPALVRQHDDQAGLHQHRSGAGVLPGRPAPRRAAPGPRC